jgi:Undecaprenyl-phosphate glucose phosphotransferase
MSQRSHQAQLKEVAGPRAEGGAISSPPTIRYEQLSALAREAAEAISRHSISPVLLTGAARLAEFALIAFAGTLIYAVYVLPRDGFDIGYAVPIIAGSFLAVAFNQMAGAYSIAALRHAMPSLGRAFAGWALVFALFAVIAFLAKIGDQYSRIWIGTWFVTGLALLTLFRTGLAVFVRRWTLAGLLDRRAVIVGGGEPAEALIRAIEAEPDSSVRIVGIFDDRKDERSPSVVAGYPKLGSVAELVDFGRVARVDLLIVSLPITAESRLLQVLKKLWVLPVDIRLSAHTNKLRFRPRTYSFVGNVPFFDVIDRPIADWDYVGKWLFDRIVGTIALILLSPVMALVALAIRLDSPGPALFKQKRYGFNNELVEVYKFRSMYVNQSDSNATKLVTRDDPRVTRVGRFIRKTSLDELPQLFNVVFRGNLSLVGPRPHAVQAKASNRLYDEVVDGYFARHRVKPGITGWAQINGWRGETDTDEKIQQRVAHDLFYIENWSIFFDLYILLLTPFRLFSTRNAY